MAPNTPREPANQAVYQTTTEVLMNDTNEVRALKFTIQFLKDQNKELQQELTTALDDNLKIHKENLTMSEESTIRLNKQIETMRQENIKMRQEHIKMRHDNLEETLKKILI